MGTRVEARGRGLASSLLRRVTDVCDRDQVGAWLESSNEANVPLYERHGFRVVEVVIIDTDKETGTGLLRVPLMWREPQPLSQPRAKL